MSDLGLRHGVVMGVAQSLALMPGVSRTGITITAGRFMGLDRDSAARFSFLLLVPTVFGAALWTGVKDVLLGDLPPGWKGPFVVGILAAAGSGLLAIHWLLGYVRRHNYTVFVVYRLVIALVIVLLIVSGAYKATF
jgi:undecaprenyl-diphosphatase